MTGARRPKSPRRVRDSHAFPSLLPTVGLLLISGALSCGSDSARLAAPLERWSLSEDHLTTPGLHSQGVASVEGADTEQLVFSSRFTLDRGHGDTLEKVAVAFPEALSGDGFDHLGDLDVHGALIFGGLEDNSEPYGARFHRAFVTYDLDTLAATAQAVDPGAPDQPGDGDLAWVTVSPDGTWVATSEWDPQDSVTLFRAEDILAGGEISAAAVVPIDGTLHRIQGCDFDGPRTLICTSDDSDTGKLVWAIELSESLDASVDLTRVSGHVTPLFPTPKPANLCGAEEEVEGVDVRGDTLLVMVIGTCLVDTHLYRYTRDVSSG